MFSYFILNLLSSADAIAACPTNHGGVNYATQSCSVGGTAICSGSSNKITCDMTGGGSTGTTLYMVEDYSTTFANYEAWGTYDSTYFCCVITEFTPATPVLDTVDILGSDYTDHIYLNVTIGGTTYNLGPAGTGSLTVTVRGYEDEDTIHGSNTSTDYDEALYGDLDTDHIYGHQGDDRIYGGDGTGDVDSSPDFLYGQGGDDYMDGEGGADLVHGGGGDDTMHGGAGNDSMVGGVGDDIMYGESETDYMSGGPGDDTMDGGDDADVLCGGPHDVIGDALDDGDSDSTVDKLWGGEDSDDDVDCNNSTTQVDPNSSPTGSCSTTTLPEEPEECP